MCSFKELHYYFNPTSKFDILNRVCIDYIDNQFA